MARVRLQVQNLRLVRHAGAPNPQPRGFPFLRSDGTNPPVSYLPWRRLIAQLVIAPAVGEVLEEDLTFDAVVDTGAPLTSFPFEVWRRFRRHIRWLDQPPREATDEAGEPLAWGIAVGGGIWGYRLGRVNLGLVDDDGRSFPPERTVCLFYDEVPPGPGARPPRQALFGLRSPLWDGRQLRHAGPTDSPEWWLEDA